jgi:hypothetical protein
MKTQLLKFLQASLVPGSGSRSLAVAVALLTFFAGLAVAHAGSVGFRGGCYWSAMAPGMVFSELPTGYVQVSAGGTGYYYFDGVFFQPVASLSGGYVVVAPPVGVVVPQVPTGAELVTVGADSYYYAGGAFYVQQPTGFAAVPAPPGAVVNAPPVGATPVSVNGAVYYEAANVYYQPVVGGVGGTTLYMTVSL